METNIEIDSYLYNKIVNWRIQNDGGSDSIKYFIAIDEFGFLYIRDGIDGDYFSKKNLTIDTIFKEENPVVDTESYEDEVKFLTNAITILFKRQHKFTYYTNQFHYDIRDAEVDRDLCVKLRNLIELYKVNRKINGK